MIMRVPSTRTGAMMMTMATAADRYQMTEMTDELWT